MSQQILVKDYTQDTSINSSLVAGSSMLNTEFNEADSSDTSPLNTAPAFTDSLKYEGVNEVDARPIVTGGIVRTGTSPTRLQLSQISPDAPNFDGGEEDPALYVLQDGGVRTYLNANGLFFFTPISSPSAGSGSGSIYGFGTNLLVIDVGDEQYNFDVDFYPTSDGFADLGRAGNRWNTIYANSIDQSFVSPTPSVISGIGAGFTLSPTTGYVLVSATAPRTSDGTTAIADGTQGGQQLILQGTSDVNTITIQDGANTAMAGNCTLGNADTLSLIWDSTTWIETARSNN
jgi:hypothetical protein